MEIIEDMVDFLDNWNELSEEDITKVVLDTHCPLTTHYPLFWIHIIHLQIVGVHTQSTLTQRFDNLQ